MEHVAERLEFVGVAVMVPEWSVGRRIVDNPFRERRCDGDRCDGCGVGDGIHHHAACPVVRSAIVAPGGRLAGIPVEYVLADMAHGDVVRDAFAGRIEDDVGRCTVCRANYTEVCDRVAHGEISEYDDRYAVRAVPLDRTSTYVIRQPFDVDAVACHIQSWAARHGIHIPDDDAKESAKKVGKMVADREVNYAPECRRIAIRDAVLAIAGVSRCEVNERGQAYARALTVSVWADVSTRMHDVLEAVEQRADGLRFDVKVWLHRAAVAAIVRPTDDMRADDAVMTSQEWSAAVRGRLAERARSTATTVQTEVDADVDNFGDAP